MNLYFAYGSNMSFSRIQKRCPNVSFSNIAYLQNWELIFNKEKEDKTGAANIRRCDDKIVWGVLYQLTDEDQLKLDVFEGYDHLAKVHPEYIRETIQVNLPDHNPVSAFVYIADKNPAEISPSSDYLNYIVFGASEHGLPPEYQSFLNSFKTHRNDCI